MAEQGTAIVPVGATTPAVADIETASLEELEAIIHHGLQTFVEVGMALREIQRRKLYLEGGRYTNFNDYCRDKWGFGDKRAYQYIATVPIMEALSTQVDSGTPLPVSEQQVRELGHLAEPERWGAVWTEAAALHGLQVKPRDIRTIAHAPIAPPAADDSPEPAETPVALPLTAPEQRLRQRFVRQMLQDAAGPGQPNREGMETLVATLSADDAERMRVQVQRWAAWCDAITKALRHRPPAPEAAPKKLPIGQLRARAAASPVPLREAREARGFTVGELAKRAGRPVVKGDIEAIERGAPLANPLNGPLKRGLLARAIGLSEERIAWPGYVAAPPVARPGASSRDLGQVSPGDATPEQEGS